MTGVESPWLLCMIAVDAVDARKVIRVSRASRGEGW